MSTNQLRVITRCMNVLVAVVIGVIPAAAQDFFLHDNFNDGDITAASAGGIWQLRNPAPGATLDASSGDLVVDSPNGFSLVPLISADGLSIERRSEWSFRARMTVDLRGFAGVGTDVFNHAALRDGLLRGGTDNIEINTVPMRYDYLGQEVFLQMDAFNSQVVASVWKAGDPDSLVQTSRPYLPTNTIPAAGVGSGGIPGRATYHEVWISSSPLGVIPEPSSFALALCAFVIAALMCCRRRMIAHLVHPGL